jgi:hypothetical protein
VTVQASLPHRKRQATSGPMRNQDRRLLHSEAEYIGADRFTIGDLPGIRRRTIHLLLLLRMLDFGEKASLCRT